MNRAAVSFALVASLVLSACGREAEPTPDGTTLTTVGQRAPGFRLETLEGEVFDLEDNRGRVVLLNFFATWCPPCREELPHLELEIWEAFDEEAFALLVIGREETPEVLRAFAAEHGYTMPFAADPDRSVYGLYASRFIPRNVVVGPDGTILFQSQGFERAEFDHMVGVIRRALAGADERKDPPERL